MRMRLVVALGAGFLAALGAASFPASAADAVVAAQSGSKTWSQPAVTIKVGEKVTWTNDGGYHNVCVQRPGTSGDACDEFTNGPIDNVWTSASHQFVAPGTYAFFCAAHRAVGMTGTITVEAASTGMTETTTVPTQTQAAPAPADATAPSFTGKLKRRPSRKALTLEFGSTEAGTLKASVYRRPPRGRAFSRISQASLKVKQGHNVVTLPRKPNSALRRGSYKVKLQLVDVAGNKSGTKTLRFKIA
jgi:plastocyanin